MDETIIEERATVSAASDLGAGYFLLQLQAPRIAAKARPGQFVMARPQPGFDPLLRRPLGILLREGPSIFLYFHVRGRGTALLAAKQKGDSLDLLGPAGNAFPDFAGRRVLLIAGGRGIVPLFFHASVQAARSPISLAYGGRSLAEMHLLERVNKLPLSKLHLYSEDGSLGKKGLVTDDLESIIAAEGCEVTLACGPDAMFNSLHGKLAACRGDHYVALEARMGCGFGICHSCAVAAADGGYRKVCDEGPLFAQKDLQWPI